jgi:hypothetical protein
MGPAHLGPRGPRRVLESNEPRARGSERGWLPSAIDYLANGKTVAALNSLGV